MNTAILFILALLAVLGIFPLGYSTYRWIRPPTPRERHAEDAFLRKHRKLILMVCIAGQLLVLIFLILWLPGQAS